ncbi:hypothetical protein Bca4012_023590 [Brassica carinata]
MDSALLDRAWDKWVTGNVGSSGSPLKAAVLINYDPAAPSRLLSTIAEQEGIDLYPVELKQFIDFMRRGNLPTDTFVLGSNQYIITSIHENWFAARCLNTTQPAGEGAIVMQTAVYVLVALYDGSIGSASRAMAAADHFASQLSLVRSGTKYRWFTVTDCIFTKITLKQKEKLGRAMNPSMDKSSLKISFRYKTRA